MTDDPLRDLRRLDLPFDVDEVIPECHECIRNQLKKYQSYVYPDGRRANKFEVDCQGIKKEVIPKQLEHKYTQEELFKLRSMLDPVFFSENFVVNPKDQKPFMPRDYQILALRCTSPRQVLRWSRRTGKCISGDAKVLTKEGRILAKDLVNMVSKPSIATFDEEDFTLKFSNIYRIWSNGIKPVYRLKTCSGKETKITDNHPFLVLSKNGTPDWIELKDLKVGDKIAIPGSYEELSFKEKPIGIRKARMLGYLTGDGGTNGKTATRFSNIDKEILDDFNSILGDYGCELKKDPNSDCDYNVVGSGENYSKRGRNWVNEIVTDEGIRGLAINKKVPSSLFCASKQDVCNYLGAYWDCDGWASVDNKIHNNRKKPNIEVGVGTSSFDLAHDISHLLLKIGIFSNISYKKAKLNGKEYDHWHVVLSGKSNILRFYENVPLRAKKENIERVVGVIEKTKDKNSGKSKFYTIPKNICEYIDIIRKERNISVKKLAFDKETGNSIKFSKSYSPSRRKIVAWNETLNDSYLHKICNSKVLWDEIKSIEYVDEEETFDLTVPETHTLIADDIISHNTASICLKLIHKMLTVPKVRIILAAPMIEQVENIFVRVRDFFMTSPALKSSIANFKRSPHELTLKNESILKGFAAGSVARGGDGTTIRGQDADIVLIEEADYVAQQAFIGAIIPLLSTSPDTQLIAFSTPLGMTTTPFYKLCNQSPDYKEFHYTYRVLPWADEVEKQRHNMTEEQWNREYEATFADISAGVYKPKYIDRALTNYLYKDQQRIPYWSYCMGVDWNEKHGAEIVILGHDPHVRKFKIVDAIHIGGSEFTQLNSVAKVVEVYKKWKPDYIYADSGNGSTNVELLMHMAKKAMPGDDVARFKYILKKYDSGAKVEVRDIITGEKVKKAAKPFMVDASIRMFEQARINISDSDSVLEKQLRNYMIERYTETNVPKFGLLDPAVEDHRLDAFNLAVVAFQLEFTDLFKREYFVGAAIANNPLKGEKIDNDEEDEPNRGIPEKERKNIPSTTQRKFYNSLNGESLRLLNKRDSGWGLDPIVGRKNIDRGKISRHKAKPSRNSF